MQLLNATRMQAGYSVGVEPSGRELLVIVLKGTFRIPAQSGELLTLHDEQLPLTLADAFHGEPGLSAPMYESDFALRKQRCDILLNGSAYAPEGKPAERVVVGLRIGTWQKGFAVLGDRTWHAHGMIRTTAPEPFTVTPISYDRAFGGADQRHEDPASHAVYLRNPVGRGFHKHLREDWVHDSPMPNTEELSRPVTRPDGNYVPMAFGPLGRQWEPRFLFAGTYDQQWVDHVAPFLPADFDDRYYQCAPADQQLPIPLGEQEVTLMNLTADGRRVFRIPHLQAPVHVFPKSGKQEDLTAHADTVIIEPDFERVTITWRVAHPLKKNLFELDQVLVGRKGSQWWQLRDRVAFPIPVVVVPGQPPVEQESEVES
jgi:hypothetical protein